MCVCCECTCQTLHSVAFGPAPHLTWRLNSGIANEKWDWDETTMTTTRRSIDRWESVENEKTSFLRLFWPAAEMKPGIMIRFLNEDFKRSSSNPRPVFVSLFCDENCEREQFAYLRTVDRIFTSLLVFSVDFFLYLFHSSLSEMSSVRFLFRDLQRGKKTGTNK